MCWQVPSYVFILWKTALTCEEQTHSAKTNCPDPQGTDSWCEGLEGMNFPDIQGTDLWCKGLDGWRLPNDCLDL